MGRVTKFDRLSLSLNAMLGRIERLNEGLRQVSDNIAHDLKTPLTRLRNRAEAALAGDGGGEAHREALEQMIADSDQLIRTFKRAVDDQPGGSGIVDRADERGRSVGPGVPTPPSSTSRWPRNRGIRLVARIEPGITIRGNRELLAQALSNLIDNAVQICRWRCGAGDLP